MITMWFDLVVCLMAFYLGAFVGHSMTGEDLGFWAGGVVGLVLAVHILYRIGM